MRRRRRGGGFAMTADPAGLRVLGIIAAVLVAVVDQASKWWILEQVMNPAPRVVEVTDFFNLVLVWNPGVSFGLFQADADYMPWVLTGVALLVAGLVGRWLWAAERWTQALALGLVIGGAVGNVADRARFGAVCDFLDFHFAGWHFWAFNVADAGISVGVALLLIDGLFFDRETS